jgi:hypothetical protein
MPVTTKYATPLQQLITISGVSLEGGVTLPITTLIKLTPNPPGTGASNYEYPLQSCRCIYKETGRVGAPVIPDPELTQVNGFVVVTLVNTAAPGNQSVGELLVWCEHSIAR